MAIEIQTQRSERPHNWRGHQREQIYKLSRRPRYNISDYTLSKGAQETGTRTQNSNIHKHVRGDPEICLNLPASVYKMLLYLQLVMLVVASASKVLKVEDHVDYKDIVHDMMHSRKSSEQYPYMLKPLKRYGLVKNYKCGQDSEFIYIQCRRMPGNIADCSRLNIKDVCQINLSWNITGLDLAFNSIQALPNNILARFTQLEWLNISHNELQKLERDSFYNLNVLKILLINSNNLTMRAGTFPDDVFKPLLSLQKLLMHNNSHVKQHMELDYPDKALSQLHKLTDLYIDGLPNKIFGHGFSKMTALTNLTLGGKHEGYCNLKILANNTFTNLTGLTHLSTINCNITGSKLGSDVFVPLTKLEYLDLTGNDNLMLEHLGLALDKIRNYTNLKVLNISNIINPYSAGVIVTAGFTNSLPRGLDELSASSNAFEVLGNGALDRLPKSLRILDVACNKFTFLDYLNDLDKLESLQTLTLGGVDIFILPYYYPSNPNVTVSFKGNYDKHSYLHQPLPPNLITLNIVNAGWSSFLTEFHFSKNNKLNILNLDSNNFPLLQGPIIGLDSLLTLSLYSCRIKKIHPIFFQNFTSLQYLNLSTNYFGRTSFETNESIFSDLANLKVLDLSFTDIREISYNTFKGLNKLESIFLQINPIYEFNVNISHMTNLTYLNLSMTELVTLNSEMRQILDNFSSNFTLDLTMNTFECFCSNLEFLKWITTTKVIPKETQITCSFVDGSKIDLNLPALVNVYNKLNKDCACNVELFSIVMSATFLLLFAIAGAILFNFRWKLRYLYYSAILHYKTKKPNTIEETFEFDVFVSYAHEDHDFVVNILYPHLQSSGLKILIHGLHFTAGDFISSNIVNAVRISKHTLVVMTQHHLNSKWSKYEVEMANMEQVYTGRSVLLFLIKENISKLTTQLFFHIKNNTYIKYPMTQENSIEMRVFWSKLVSDLKS